MILLKYKDYYKILGVEKTDDHESIKKAYRKLAKANHPDAHPNDPEALERFKEISEAYEVLGDPEKRKKYDHISNRADSYHGDDFDPSSFGFQYAGGFSQGNSSRSHGFSDFFDAFFGGEGGFDINELFQNQQFHSFSGDSGRKRQSNYYSSADAEAIIEINLDEAYHGTEKRLAFQLDGTEKKLNVKVPPGVTNGEKIKLKGQGYQINQEGVCGDFYLVIQVNDSQNRKLEGLDIVEQIPVTPWEAVLGSEITVKTMEGSVRVKIPPGAQNGKRIRLKSKGFKNRKGNKGDMIIELGIRIPAEPTEQERKLFMQLAEISMFNPRKL